MANSAGSRVFLYTGIPHVEVDGFSGFTGHTDLDILDYRFTLLQDMDNTAVTLIAAGIPGSVVFLTDLSST